MRPAKTKIPMFLPTMYPTDIRAGDKSVPSPKIDPPIDRAPAAPLAAYQSLAEKEKTTLSLRLNLWYNYSKVLHPLMLRLF